MVDYTSFFLAACGAAATLLGLLFIAIQFNIDAFVEDPTNRWRAIARATFSIYILLFALPLVFLIPGMTGLELGWALIFAAAFGIYRAFRTWWPVWRAALQRRGERWLQLIRLLVAPLVFYAILAVNGLDMVRGDSQLGTFQGISLTLVGLFVIALANSWNLLVELSYERKLSKGK